MGRFPSGLLAWNWLKFCHSYPRRLLGAQPCALHLEATGVLGVTAMDTKVKGFLGGKGR